jgi:hypothetical protein
MEKVESIQVAPNKLRDKNIKRAHYVLEQLEKENIDLLKDPDHYWKICSSLATLGEEAREIWLKITELSTSIYKGLVNEDFTSGLADKKYKLPAKFFEICGDIGLKTKLPVSIKEKKEKNTARDIIGDDEWADDFEKYGFWEAGGIYWSLDLRWSRYEVSNFTMKILWHVETSEDAAYRLIYIKNIYGHTASLNLNTDDFVSVGAFKKAVARKGNFIWKGSEVDLCRLQEKLQRDERPTNLVKQLGWNKRGGFYAFANGIYDIDGAKFIPVDEFGIVELTKTGEDGVPVSRNYFIPAYSKIFEEKDDLFTNDKKFVYKKSDITFQQWAAQFCEVYGKHGQLMMIFFIMSLFSDITFKALMRRFPLFFVQGKRGSGKGTMIGSIMRMFGEGQDQIMIGGSSTSVGMMRKFSQYSNAFVWVDEYKNNLQPRIIESLKNLFDRIGYERGKKDNTFETESTPIRSACILSGQEMPTIEPALFTRCILTVLTETKYTDAQRENFRKLEKMESQGLSNITADLLKYRPYFEANYQSIFESEQKALMKAVNNNEIDERLYVNYAAMIAAAELISGKEALPFSVITFRELCKSTIQEQFFVLKGSDDASKFWDVVEMLFEQNIIREGQHFKLANGYLYIRIQDIHQYYAEMLIKRKDPNGLDKQTLNSYLENDTKSFVKRDKKFFGGSQKWCHIFHYAELGIDLIRADNQDELHRRYKEMRVEFKDDDDDSDIKKQGVLAF